MSVMSELDLETGGLPLAAYHTETRVEIVVAWLRRSETERLDTLLGKYKVLTRGFPREEARRIWRESMATYLALNGGV
jgi:hypothetical protein